MHGGWKVSRWDIVMRVDTHEKLVDHFISEDHNTSTLFNYFVLLAIIVQNIAHLFFLHCYSMVPSIVHKPGL